MMRTRNSRWIGGVAASALLAACGGGDAPTPTGRALSAPAEAASAAVNQPPRIERVALDPREPAAGAEVVARVQAIDPDGDAIELQYTWLVEGRRVAERGASLRVPEGAGKNAAIEVEVVAHDGREGSAPMGAQGRVANRSPELLGVHVEPVEGVKVGSELMAVADARDADGDPVELSFQWRVNGRPTEATGPRFSTAECKRGDRVQVRAVAGDGAAETPPLDSAPVTVGNSAPVISSTPGAMSPDGTYRYTVAASDPDGDRSLRFRLAEGPPGALLDPVLGELTWAATREHVGRHAFEVLVEDGQGGEARQRFEVEVREVARAPEGDEDAPVASIE